MEKLEGLSEFLISLMELLIDFNTSMNSRYLRTLYKKEKEKYLNLLIELNIKNIFYIKVII